MCQIGAAIHDVRCQMIIAGSDAVTVGTRGHTFATVQIYAVQWFVDVRKMVGTGFSLCHC